MDVLSLCFNAACFAVFSAARALRPHPRPSRGPPRRRQTHALWPLRSSPKRTTSLLCLRHPSRARASEEKASKLGLRVSRSQSVCCTLASTCPLVDLAPDAKLFCTTFFLVKLQPRLVMSEIGASQTVPWLVFPHYPRDRCPIWTVFIVDSCLCLANNTSMRDFHASAVEITRHRNSCAFSACCRCTNSLSPVVVGKRAAIGIPSSRGGIWMSDV